MQLLTIMSDQQSSNSMTFTAKTEKCQTHHFWLKTNIDDSNSASTFYIYHIRLRITNKGIKVQSLFEWCRSQIEWKQILWFFFHTTIVFTLQWLSSRLAPVQRTSNYVSPINIDSITRRRWKQKKNWSLFGLLLNFISRNSLWRYRLRDDRVYAHLMSRRRKSQDLHFAHHTHRRCRWANCNVWSLKISQMINESLVINDLYSTHVVKIRWSRLYHFITLNVMPPTIFISRFNNHT